MLHHQTTFFFVTQPVYVNDGDVKPIGQLSRIFQYNNKIKFVCIISSGLVLSCHIWHVQYKTNKSTKASLWLTKWYQRCLAANGPTPGSLCLSHHIFIRALCVINTPLAALSNVVISGHTAFTSVPTTICHSSQLFFVKQSTNNHFLNYGRVGTFTEVKYCGYTMVIFLWPCPPGVP